MALEALLAELNVRQREAATLPPTHALILAGAGTGKTKTIIARAAYLIASGTPAERIRILTFTRRAAAEIVDRVRQTLGTRADGLQASTFHVWCVRLLRRAPQLFGIGAFTLIDRDDQVQLFRQIRGKRTGELFPRASEIADVASFMRNARVDLATALAQKLPEAVDLEAELVPMLAEYERRKRERGYLDFDDILDVVARRMAESPATRDWIARQYDHLLVDEMQDTNPLQWALLEPLSRSVTLFCVGDDAQSIYAFRGADFQNVHSFRERVAGAMVLKLEDSYRATQEILDLANWLLAQSPLNYDRRLSAVRGSGQRPRLLTFSGSDDAAEWIAEDLSTRNKAGARWSDQLILVRGTDAARGIERALLEADIPYIFIGGSKLLESAHVRDLLSVLRISVNPQDEMAWLRLLTLWPGIGDVTAQRIIANLLPLGDLERQIIYLETVPKVSHELLDLVNQATDRPDAGHLVRMATVILEPVLEERYSFEEWPRRQGDFAYVAALADQQESVQSFLEEYILEPISQSEAANREQSDVVRISTIHSAKGTECAVCYVPDVSVSSYPSKHAAGDTAAIEEERRVLYVALTRARNELILTRRQPFGQYRRWTDSDANGSSDRGEAPETAMHIAEAGDALTAAYFLNQLPDGFVEHDDRTPPPRPLPPQSLERQQRREPRKPAVLSPKRLQEVLKLLAEKNDADDGDHDDQPIDPDALLAQIQEQWDEIRRAVRQQSPTLEALLQAVRPVAIMKRTVILSAYSQFHRTGIEQPTNRRIIEDALSMQLGRRLRVYAVTEADLTEAG